MFVFSMGIIPAGIVYPNDTDDKYVMVKGKNINQGQDHPANIKKGNNSSLRTNVYTSVNTQINMQTSAENLMGFTGPLKT